MRARWGVALLPLVLAGVGCGDDEELLGPGNVTVELAVRHSRFLPDRLAVAEGTTVRFVVANEDPIDHELIVGGPDVHARHETGTEAEHGAVPGEVSVPAGTTRETTFRFDDAGTVRFACHLPKHLDYGMKGEVAVRDRP
jgi:uncharacterized cupredoxin-like copper-binding protein